MSQLTDNLNLIVSIKSNIKSAIENKGVDMTGVSFGSYADKIGEISGGGGQFVTEPLNVTSNGTYTPGQGVDGFSTVTVDVPQSVTGYTQKEITEGVCITNLNNSASFVRAYAFQQCSSLQTVSLPACTIVRGYAFQYCSSLQTVSLPVCSYVDRYAFQQCYSLQTVSLPVCKTVNANAFIYCYSLQTVSLPVCTTVENQVFFNCTSLSSVNLPVCSNIQNFAFRSCSSLSVVYIGTEISTVCVLNNTNVFQGCSSLTSIYVPASLVESYKAATNWTYFSDKIVGI